MLIPPKAKAIGYPQHIFMIQLKTLNDLNVTLNTKYYLDKKLKNIVPIYDLRQEAIKWIKELMQTVRIEGSEIHYNPIKELDIDYYEQHHESVIVFIEHFFNITDEDLKE